MLRGTEYANVVSTMALVVAMGGTAYAAASLPRNSVGSPQIRNDAVRSVDVKDDGITAADIEDGSLGQDDFAPGELPDGASGAAGGVLAGGYPDPEFSDAAPGVAIAAVSSQGITATPSINVWFNRLGGRPSIVKTADPSASEYAVTFPGLTADRLANVVAVGSAEGTHLSVTTRDGSLIVARGTSAGPFTVVVYAANPGGTTNP